MQSMGANLTTVQVTPSITAGAYAINAQLGGVQVLPQVSLGNGLAATLINLIVIDKDKQDAPLVIYFFNSPPVVISSDNQAINISDQEMIDKCVGFISVGASDYTDLAVNSIAMVNQQVSFITPESNGSLWAVAKVGDTPTYTATGNVVIRYVFSKNF